MEQATTDTIDRLPGQPIQATITAGKVIPPVPRTYVSGSLDFDKAKSFLSSRPMRRPNRQRPIDV